MVYYNEGGISQGIIMARAFIRGRSFNQYLKVGYNVVRRFQKGDAPDNDNDLFEWLCSAKTRKAAKKKTAKHEGETEIMVFKKQEPVKDN